MKNIMFSTGMSERTMELMQKPVTELCQRIIELEDENARMKEFRSKLIKIRNIIATDEEKKPQGRPRKEQEKDFI